MIRINLVGALRQLAALRAAVRRLPEPVEDCRGCSTDPAEYAFCRRWRSGDPACRPKKRTRR